VQRPHYEQPSYAGAFSEERKFKIIGQLQQVVHDTHGFYSKIINEMLMFVCRNSVSSKQEKE